MAIWTLGTNLDVNYCVAAFLVSRLKGAARRVGLRIPQEDLQPLPAVEAVHAEDGAVITEDRAADYMRGISDMLSALEEAFNPQRATGAERR